MSIFSILETRFIAPNLRAGSKEEAIEELVVLLEKGGRIMNRGLVIRDVLEREKAGSTGLEHGVAVPHAKTTGVPELTVALGISRSGIDFDSIDAEPAHIIFLVLSTPDLSGPHIAALKEIAFLVGEENVRKRILEAVDAEGILKILKKD
jgi:mannitol/fructose-specific phosphotransferase system IIA component (Ntr-type)